MKLEAKMQVRLEKRKKRIRARMQTSTIRHRVIVNKTNKHFYAQLYDSVESRVVTGAATSAKTFKADGGSNSIASCVALGKEFAATLKNMQVEKVVFDRSGLRYHGKVKAFADALREGGIAL